MNEEVEKIVMEALELPLAMRAFLAEKLLASLDLDEPLSVAWKSEVRRRCQEIDRGTVQLRDAESVFEKAYKVLE